MKLTVKRERPPVINIIFAVLTVLVSLAAIGAVVYSQLLPSKYFLVALIAVTILVSLIVWLLIKMHASKPANIIGYILSILVIIGSIFGMMAIANSLALLGSISNSSGDVVKMSIIVKEDSELKTVDDVQGKSLSAVKIDDEYLSQIKDQVDLGDYKYEESYPKLAKDLLDDKAEAIVYNEGYRGLLEEEFPKFDDEIRVIKTFEFKKKEVEKKEVDTSKGFNLYISGVDTYGSLSTVARSDVNIVATINHQTHKILLTTIPRDAYLPIALGGGNQRDKLTHAGIYGVESSMQTMAGALDTEINNYARLNFTTFIGIVDKIGGITVNNPTAFRSISGDSFPAGQVQLNGQRALAYSRERKNISGGDFARGQNQQRVIEGIFDKLTSPAVLANYQEVMSVLGNSLDSNIPRESLVALINQQVDYGGSWNISSIEVKGKGQTGGLPSAAMPGYQLYMVVLDQSSLQDAKQSIKETLSSSQ